MSVLVAQQGEILNQIDTNVRKAADYTDSGVEEMKHAVKIQKRTRKVFDFSRADIELLVMPFFNAYLWLTFNLVLIFRECAC
jgi:t-SNARE complex subunit (syntaxin)